MMRRFSDLALAVTTCTTTALTLAPALAVPPPESYLGAWTVNEMTPFPLPDGGTAWIRSNFVFTPTEEIVRTEAFADAEGKEPLLTYESSGPYTFGAQSQVVPGAWEIDLTNDASLMTIHVENPDLWNAVNLGDCPLAVGQAVEISGCVSGPPFNSAGCVDMDLLQVTATELRFGDEQADRCNERPLKLGSARLVRETQ